MSLTDLLERVTDAIDTLTDAAPLGVDTTAALAALKSLWLDVSNACDAEFDEQAEAQERLNAAGGPEWEAMLAEDAANPD